VDDLRPAISASIAEHRAAVALMDSIVPSIAEAAEAMIASALAGGTLLVCGNGGSAADAQHIAAEYVGRFLRERQALPAIALHTNASALTAIANDYGFETVFARQVRAYGRPGDVLLALSTSGESANVLEAVLAAREIGVTTIALCGGRGGAVSQACHIAIGVPSDATPRVQEMHILVGHILCGLVEEAVCERP
jgi:D-sedoheptulose 7-phosphate isomerase